MSEVDRRAAPTRQQAMLRPRVGSFVWYELITPDAEGSKAFYDKVVGWNFGEPVARISRATG